MKWIIFVKLFMHLMTHPWQEYPVTTLRTSPDENRVVLQIGAASAEDGVRDRVEALLCLVINISCEKSTIPPTLH